MLFSNLQPAVACTLYKLNFFTIRPAMLLGIECWAIKKQRSNMFIKCVYQNEIVKMDKRKYNERQDLK